MIKTLAICCFLFSHNPLLTSIVADSELRLLNNATELKVTTDQFSEHGILFIETKSIPEVVWSKSRLTVTFPNSHYTGSSINLKNKAARSIRLSTNKHSAFLKIITQPKLAIREHVDIVQSGNGWQVTVSERPFSASYRQNSKKVAQSSAKEFSPQSLEQLTKALSDSGDLKETQAVEASDTPLAHSHSLQEENSLTDDSTNLSSVDDNNALPPAPPQGWDIDSNSTLATKPPPSTITSFIAITLLLSVLGLAAFVFQRNRQKSPFSNKAREFEVIERIALGHRQQVVRLRIGQSDLILGVTEHNIQPLGDFASLTRKQDAQAIPLKPKNQLDCAPELSKSTAPPAPTNNSRVNEFKAKLANALTRESSDHHTPKRTKPKTIPAHKSKESLKFHDPNPTSTLNENEDPVWTRKNIA